jgi:hypothetical protein
MGTKSPLDNCFKNYRAFHRQRVRKAKAYAPSAESSTLTVRGAKYSTAKKAKKDNHRERMAAKRTADQKKKQRQLKAIAEKNAKKMSE